MQPDLLPGVKQLFVYINSNANSEINKKERLFANYAILYEHINIFIISIICFFKEFNMEVKIQFYPPSIQC